VLATEKNEIYTIALMGIECPGPGQSYGDHAIRFLEKRLLHRRVTAHIYGKDRSKNYLAVVTVEGRDVRLELLKAGLAWTAEKNPLRELEVHRLEAAAGKKGLWSEENPTPPWIYRRQQSMAHPKSR
jgi:endonuclease YncB( thermonuclease family)